MSLSPHCIAVRGVGYGAQSMSMLGFRELSVAPIPDAGGGYPWPFVYPKSSHLSNRIRRSRRMRDADLVLLTTP